MRLLLVGATVGLLFEPLVGLPVGFSVSWDGCCDGVIDCCDGVIDCCDGVIDCCDGSIDGCDGAVDGCPDITLKVSWEGV